ncbi:MAG: 2-oxoglutarate dehydrogenase E1 component, partial [Rhodospirillales bacterium]|nr:2-oxoglutarate dehydrogenase E1 component [Rhodospirillales bacterium]
MTYPANASLLAELYQRFLKAPDQLEPDWRRFFGDLDDEAAALVRELNGAGANGQSATAVAAGLTGGGDITADHVRAATLDSIRALMLIRAYRVRGHLEAKLDPLGLKPVEPHPELDPRTYGFTEADMDRPIFINKVLGLETATLAEIMAAVRETYCGKIGVEYMHIQDPAQKA